MRNQEVVETREKDEYVGIAKIQPKCLSNDNQNKKREDLTETRRLSV